MQKEALCYKQLSDKVVRCDLCAHHCRIGSGETGFCHVRRNDDGILHTLAYGETVARNVDPIEKKPLYHFLPGTLSYSIATAGCNFHCGFCQNWRISQTDGAVENVGDGRPFPPADVVQHALRRGCRSIAYTYTEPTVFFEYARDTGITAREAGLKNIFVTNGFMTRQALDMTAGWLDAANVDLKAWRNDYYRDVCSGRIKPVLDTIEYLKQLGVWVEVTTLLIPGENDADAELKGIAEFIAGVGREIPWHISRFHPDYQFAHHAATPMERLQKAENIGRAAGLKYVYLGNVAGDKNTCCPACGRSVVRRSAMGLGSVDLDQGRCRYCGEVVDGIWH